MFQRALMRALAPRFVGIHASADRMGAMAASTRPRKAFVIGERRIATHLAAACRA